MAKNLFHFFHKDGASLSLGSIAALGSARYASETGVEVEVFVFGSAQKMLTATDTDGPVRTFNDNIDQLVESGVRVSACINAAEATGTDETLAGRGIILENAKDVYARCAIDGTNIITF